MIEFDGVDINSVAPVKIEDIQLSSPTLEPTINGRAIRAGSDFVRMREGTRTVQITFALLEENKETRMQQINLLKAWAKRDKEYILRVDAVPGKHLVAVCTGFPEPSLRQWWESSLNITFTCYDDPFWISDTEKTASCGTEFTVLGDAPPLMRIEHTFSASASNVSYSNGSQSMSFSTIPAGDLVIDLNNQTAVVGNSSVMANYAFTSRFLLPKVGVQTITGTGTIKYRERWL